MKKRAEIELGYKLKNASAVTRFSARLRQAFDQAGADADKLNRRMGLVERAVDKLPAKWRLAGGSAARALEKTSRAADRAWARLKGGASTVTGVIGRLTRGVFNLKTALIGLGLGYVAKGFLDVSRETENYHTRLTTLLGSQKAATQAMQYFQDVAAKVPFTLRDVVESGTALEAFGANSRQWLEPLNDLAAVMGIELPEAAQALGRAYAGGAGAADIFRERGILQIIKDAAKLRAGIDDITKLSLPQFRRLMLLTFTDPDGKIAGASARLATNWDGMISMLSDKWFRFRQKMMAAGVFDLLKSQLQRLLDALDQNKDKIAEWAERAGRAVEGALQKGVNFVGNIINNWSQWEARWEKFKSGAAEVWRQTKNVAGVVGSLLKTALDGWNSLPDVVKTWGILGAVMFGGKIGKIMLAMSVVSAGIDATGDLMKRATNTSDVGERYQKLYDQKFAELSGREPGIITSFLGRASGGKNAQQAHEWALAQLRKPSQQSPGTAAPSYKDLEAQLMADVQTGLSVSQASLKRALTMQPSARGGAAPRTDWRSQLGKATAKGLTDAEKLVAKANAATAKRQQEYIRMIAESVELEKQLRRQGLTDHERNLDQLKDKYETTQERIDDLVLGGVITEKKAAGLKAKLNTLYLGEVQKAQAKHDQSLLRSIKLNGLKGRELKLAQLQFELQDLEEAGHSAVLIEQYKAQQLEEINKSWLERTLDAWGDAQSVIPEATKNALQGTQSAWANYLASGLKSFESFTDAIEATWRQMLAQLIAQWSMSGFAGLVKDFINLLKGGSGWSNTIKGFGLEGLLGGEKGGGGVVGTAGSLASVYGLGKSALASLGILGPTAADSITAGFMAAGPATQAAAEAALAAQVSAALGTQTAAEGALAAYGGTMAGGEFAGTFGATSGLSAMAGPMALALGPGMLGMGLSQMGFLMGGPMTPEEAKSNWEGQAHFIEGLTSRMQELGQTLGQLEGSGFEPFGQAAKEAAGDLERLKTVAGYSQDQVDALVGAMNPLAQQFIKSGQAANSLDAKIAQLTTDLQASQHDGFTPGADRARELAAGLDEIAMSANLGHDKLVQVHESLVALTGQAQRGEISIEQMARRFREDLVTALGETKNSAESAADAMGRVLSLGGGISQMSLADSIGGKDPLAGRIGDVAGKVYDPMTGPSPALGNAELGYYHGGGVVERLMRRLPRFHDGGDVLSWLQPGEFVTRRRSVNPATLPTLRHINRTGRPPDQTVHSTSRDLYVTVQVGDVGEKVDQAAITAAAEAGVLAALRRASEAGVKVIDARGVYDQAEGY
jgi:hypothetical protein